MPSSVIAGIVYDPLKKVLEITFVSGKVYAYYGVPDEEYIGLMKSKSKGHYLNEFIKPYYDFRRLS